MLIKFAPASVATAFASIVFPVPGGPNKRMPLQGCRNKEIPSIIFLMLFNSRLILLGDSTYGTPHCNQVQWAAFNT